MSKNNDSFSFEKHKEHKLIGEATTMNEINLREICISNNKLLSTDKRFEVVKAIVPSLFSEKKEKYFVVDRGIPAFQINEWLNTKNSSINTGKKYANILSRFLNYLHDIGKEYWNVTNTIIEDYVLFLLYQGKKIITWETARLSYKSIVDNIGVLKHFYKWLSQRINRVSIEFTSIEMKKNYAYLYGQIFSSDYEHIIEKHLSAMPSSKEYIKWYTSEEIDILVSNFCTLRDKAIFMCTVDGGMRIDEVLSIKLLDYNPIERTVTPTRSKGISSDGEFRTIVLPASTCEIIDNYVFTERSDAEFESGRINEYLFINIKRGQAQGLKLGYNNYYRIFKRCAKKAGFDEEKIRTHSGRSTKTMELLKHQALHPEDSITDMQIMMIMGWRNPKSISPYRDHRNVTLGKLAQEKINKKGVEDANKNY